MGKQEEEGRVHVGVGKSQSGSQPLVFLALSCPVSWRLPFCHPPLQGVKKNGAKEMFLSFGLDGETFWYKMPGGLVSYAVFFCSGGE